jgi:hypothetical protein
MPFFIGSGDLRPVKSVLKDDPILHFFLTGASGIEMHLVEIPLRRIFGCV